MDEETRSARLLLFGTDEPAVPTRVLRAGRLTARLHGAGLRAIEVDGREVWHGVAFLYRDPHWGTPEPVVDGLEHDESADGFRIRIRGHIAAAAQIDFEIAIEGTPCSLHYEVMAVARGDTSTNRCGLCVMHPLAACGRPVVVEHTDGRSSASTFPTLVAPWPPFTLVRAVRHEYADGAWAGCRLSGDDFELEDQRNNADASFKTYSRSNLMARPYPLRAGEVLRQSAQLRLESLLPALAAVPARRTAAALLVRVGALAGTLPLVGTAIAPADTEAPPPVRSALRALAPAFLHLTLARPDDAVDWPGVAQLLGDAGDCGLRLDLCGLDHCDAEATLGRLEAALRAARLQPATVAVFPSTAPVLAAARRVFPHSLLGGGTPDFFTQLNRIEGLGPTQFLSFTTASVVHGADDEDVMAGLQSLAAMIDTLRLRHGALPVHVGPSGIAARRSPLGPQPASDGTRRIALARRDPRTSGLFGAAWVLGYVAQFTHAGVQALSLLDLQGDAALVGAASSTPAFELLRHLHGPAGWREVSVSEPAAVAVLALQRAGHCETLVANLRHEPVTVALEGLDWSRGARIMDTASLQQRLAHPGQQAWRSEPLDHGLLRLAPYSVARV